MKELTPGQDEKGNDHEEQSANNSSDNETCISCISWFLSSYETILWGWGEGSSTTLVVVQAGSFQFTIH
jgi:hypothetical protein